MTGRGEYRSENEALWLRWLSKLVPGHRRRTWLREWSGELGYEQQLRRSRGESPLRRRLVACRSAAGAAEDALRAFVRRQHGWISMGDCRAVLRSLVAQPMWSATAIATLVSAAIMLVVVGSYELPAAVILTAITLSGILQGVLLPSRDLLIRAVTPQGSMGKVLGFLTTGMMLAAAAVQPVFGWLMDIQEPRWVFWLSAIFVVGGLFCFAGASSTTEEKQPA